MRGHIGVDQHFSFWNPVYIQTVLYKGGTLFKKVSKKGKYFPGGAMGLAVFYFHKLPQNMTNGILFLFDLSYPKNMKLTTGKLQQ